MMSDGGFLIVNDHNPGPLRRRFEMCHADESGWACREEAPDVWCVRVSRPAPNATEAG